MQTITTTEELRLDLLARALMGSAYDGNVEALLVINPGLAAGGTFVPAGTVLVVPDARPPATITVPNPWD